MLRLRRLPSADDPACEDPAPASAMTAGRRRSVAGLNEALSWLLDALAYSYGVVRMYCRTSYGTTLIDVNSNLLQLESG